MANGQLAPVVKPPTIIHALAVEKGSYHGYTWKTNIETEAGDATMDKISSVVDQPGGADCPAKPQWGREEVKNQD